ncbi:hypothetical protein [uncultured Desulfosarcina sp.]|uniref:hypothetical protein n=1 Tax=uncultured Desulfosarcina sp. TaxID=218289 RepID=UPI0029C9272C|nr:hypothetical protein [uncultured Desulfosarcina sp.]
MSQRPSIPVKINGIIRTTDDAVLVRLPSGKARWVPRRQAEFSPGHVILTPWMAAKLKTDPVGGNHGKNL